jgi:aspartyl-tRNA(Asn)/glutamyl-tRNA(Gln) amidotransferase subunit C
VLTLEQVRHVATLARLALTPEEEKLYQHQLSAILDSIDLLRSLNTDAVEPTSHATLLATQWREDVVQRVISPEQALSNAPAKVESSFAVPKIIE